MAETATLARPYAEAVFRLMGVKPEFLPEIVPQPYYGLRNY